MAKILTICLSPVIQKTIKLKKLDVNCVNRSSVFSSYVSGKGVNVSRVLLELGSNVEHLTAIGGDNYKTFRLGLKKLGIKLHWVNSGVSVRNCTTLLSSSTKSTTEIVEESFEVSVNCESRLISSFTSIINRFDTLVISGSRPKGFSSELIPQLVKLGKMRNLFVVLDIKGEDLKNSIQYKPNVIKPNLDEFIDTFGSKTDVKKKMLQLFNNGIYVVVTDSENKVMYTESGVIESRSIIKSSKTVNTTGCGDAFCAGLVHSLTTKNSMSNAVALGVECGKLNAECFEAGTIGKLK